MQSGVNVGSWILRETPREGAATIAVTGLGRSGTTMISRVLTGLGLFMGYDLAPSSHEDYEFRGCVKQGNEEAFIAACRLRDGEREVWGFKNPAFRDRIAEWEKHMRNPRVIFIFRDVLGISIRNHLALKTDVQDELKKAVNCYFKALRQIEQSASPTLLLSYEKCLADPARAVRSIADFCGLDAPSETLEAAVNEIKPNDGRYLLGQP